MTSTESDATMWLFTRYGFYSIACASKPDGALDRDTVMVRARYKVHLQRLQKRFTDLADKEIMTSPRRDYRYRLITTKRQWASVIAELASEQEWSNFKDEVSRFQGPEGSDYTDALHAVWKAMAALQRRPA